MTWLINFGKVFLSALTFRIRGGLRIPFTDKKFPLNKTFFATWVAILMCMIQGWNLARFSTAWIAGKLCTNISGWGSYIGAIISGKVSEDDKDDMNITYFVQEKLFPWLNKAREWCLNHKGFKWIGKRLPEGSYKENGKLYGVITLSLRGGLTTFILGLCANSVPYMFVGLLQGLVYLFGNWTSKHIWDDNKGGWKISEWYWGAVLGFFALLLW